MATSLAINFASLPPLSRPSVLIVEPDPLFIESLPERLRGAMSDVAFDVCVSRDDGLSKLSAGGYHAVISDARLAEVNDFLLLNATQGLSCPVPLLVSAKGGREAQSLSGLINHGAFDILRCSSGGGEPSGIVRPALRLYQLRLTIYHRRQRLEGFRRRRNAHTTMRSEERSRILDQTILDIEKTSLLCERTVQQIESSLRILEEASRQVELHARERAMRIVRVLEMEPPSVTRGDALLL